MGRLISVAKCFHSTYVLCVCVCEEKCCKPPHVLCFAGSVNLLFNSDIASEFPYIHDHHSTNIQSWRHMGFTWHTEVCFPNIYNIHLSMYMIARGLKKANSCIKSACVYITVVRHHFLALTKKVCYRNSISIYTHSRHTLNTQEEATQHTEEKKRWNERAHAKVCMEIGFNCTEHWLSTIVSPEYSIQFCNEIFQLFNIFF